MGLVQLVWLVLCFVTSHFTIVTNKSVWVMIISNVECGTTLIIAQLLHQYNKHTAEIKKHTDAHFRSQQIGILFSCGW